MCAVSTPPWTAVATNVPLPRCLALHEHAVDDYSSRETIVAHDITERTIRIECVIASHSLDGFECYMPLRHASTPFSFQVGRIRAIHNCAAFPESRSPNSDLLELAGTSARVIALL